MNMQQMLAQANQMQRALKKALEELGKQEFSVSKGGMVTVTFYGNGQAKEINVDKDAFDPDNKEMVEETIALAINEVLAKIEEAKKDVNEKITGRREGLGF